MYQFPRHVESDANCFTMPQDAFAAYANGLNTAIACGYNFTGTRRAVEPQAVTRHTTFAARRQTAKSTPSIPKRAVISHFEDLHEKSSSIRPEEARALRAELALLPEANIDTTVFKSRRASEVASDNGILTVAEDGESSYEFSDIDVARALSRSRRSLRNRIVSLSGAQSALSNDIEELRGLQQKSEANYKKLQLLQESLLLESHDLRLKQEALKREHAVLEKQLKGTQAVSVKLSSTHHRLQRNVDALQRRASLSPESLKRAGAGSLVSSVRRKKRLQQSIERPISTLQNIVVSLDEQSQSSEKTIRELSTQITFDGMNQLNWGPITDTVTSKSSSDNDLVVVAALKTQLESSMRREDVVRKQLQNLRDQLSLSRRAASETAADIDAEMKYLKASHRSQVRITRIASSAL